MPKPQVWRSPQAKADLINIWHTIATDSHNAATRMVQRLVARAEKLADFPEMGPRRPDISTDLRMVVEGNYLILYRVSPERIEIVRVIHGARDLSELL